MDEAKAKTGLVCITARSASLAAKFPPLAMLMKTDFDFGLAFSPGSLNSKAAVLFFRSAVW